MHNVVTRTLIGAVAAVQRRNANRPMERAS
jgi:hypothetical protein